MTNEKRKIQKPSFAEKLSMKEILDQRLHPIEGSDLFRYEDGWNDLRVAQEIDQRFTKAPVLGIRIECFGHLQKASGENNTALEARTTRLENQFRRLIVELHTNGVFDRTELDTILGNIDNNKEPAK